MASVQGQEKASAFPVGHVYVVDFVDFAVDLRFESDKRLTYAIIRGADHGATDTVEIAPIEIRPGVYMMHWQQKDKTTVVHTDDFERGVAYTDITHPDMTLEHHEGTMKLVS